MKKKKILILYATAGIGHKKASMAVKAAFDEMKDADAEVIIADALDYTNKFFKWSYLKAYLTLVNKMPNIWGLSYYFTDIKAVDFIVSKLRRINNWLNSAKLAKYLVEQKFDVIVSTHFFASEVISDLKSKGTINSRLITVVTDYRLHSWWICDHTDMYVVAGDDARDDLLRWKVPADKIKVIGIPIEPVFSKAADKARIIKDAGLKDGVFTVLVVGGGFGVGPIEAIIKQLGNLEVPLQIIAVCGHNEELVKKLEALKPSMKSGLCVFGFVNNVYEYMSAADILISKSGGITVSETLAKELPMIIIAPIMGQETRNSDFMIKHVAAVGIGKVSELGDVVKYMIVHHEKIADMKKAIEKIKKPYAAFDVAKLALELCK